MYSMILMTAMTAGAPETPQFNGMLRPAACWGCVGCYGCGGCSGCWGGGYVAFRPILGWRPVAVTWGCNGCYGNCSGCWGCTGCSGVMPGRVSMSLNVWGATYSYSASTPFVPGSTSGNKYNNAAPPPKTDKKDEKKEEKKDEKKTGLEESARIILEVPANAKVFVDGNMTKSIASIRNFYTPALAPGQAYFYDVRVEMEKAGRTVVENKRVFVTAGAVIRESFTSGTPSDVATK